MYIGTLLSVCLTKQSCWPWVSGAGHVIAGATGATGLTGTTGQAGDTGATGFTGLTGDPPAASLILSVL